MEEIKQKAREEILKIEYDVYDSDYGMVSANVSEDLADKIIALLSQVLQKRDEEWQEVFSLVKKAYWDTHTALEKMELLSTLTTK